MPSSAPFRTLLLCCLLLLSLSCPRLSPRLFASSRSGQPALAPTYAHWLNQEVPYLITSDERALFLKLTTDAQRDQFITSFWQIRNPDPTSPDNTAKDEHYRRLAYANDHFGHPGRQDGWDTDQGMAYITLGPPQQRQKYPETRELKPIEIWFYENSSSALPSHFYLVFFKMSPIEDYKLYSPYIDRPQKLINSLNAINDDASAIKLLQRDISDEAAHIALTLIPGEPVDLKNPTPTLESDALLNKVRNFRNLPQNRELLGARRAAQESVSHRVLLDQDTSTLSVLATRDSRSAASAHYLFTLARAGDLILARQPDGTQSYSLGLAVAVTTATGKAVYQSTQKLADSLDPQAADHLQHQRFAIAGRLPLPPGSYKLAVTLTNLISRQTFTQSRSLLVPAFDTGLGLSQIVVAAAVPPTRATAPLLPFAFSGVRLAPLGSQGATIPQGSPLRLVMQLWKPATDPAQTHGTLDIHYLIGKFETQQRQEEDQSVDLNSFDPGGNLLLGKDLPTTGLDPGSYRLVVKVSDAATKAVAYQSMNFEVALPISVPPLYTVTAQSN